MQVNPTQMAADIRALQIELEAARRETASVRDDLTLAQRDVTQINLTGQRPPQVENWLDNGNFDFTTDAYDNAIPVPGDTQEEAARWYAHVIDPSVRVLDGAITTGTPNLTSATGGFIAGDAGKEIAVEGAGAAGANLVTTIAAYVSANAVTLTANAGTTVTAAVTRWRLQTLSNISANALRTAAHSAYATIPDPDFNKTDGWARLGTGAYDLCAPLNKNLVEPSRIVTLTGIYRLNPHVIDAGIDIGVNPNTLNSADAGFIAGDVGKSVVVAGAGPGGTNLETTIAAYIGATSVTLTAAASTTVTNALATFSMTWPTTGISLYGGIWDNTAGRRMFIEGSDFTLTVGPVGTPGATTSSEYLVVALTDFGETVASTKITVNRPSDGLFVAGSVYEALSWTNLRGILHYDVYRKTGATYHLLDRLDNGETSFFDVGVTSRTVVGYPAASEQRQRSYVEIEEGFFIPTVEWKAFRIVIPTPQTYNKGLTTDRQWLRMGITAALTGAGSKRALEIDLVGLNDRDGTFSRSANDYAAKQQTTTTPTTGSQGGAGTETPPDGCPAEDEDVIAVAASGRERVVKAINVKRGMRLLTSSGFIAEVRAVDVGEPEQMMKLYTDAGLEREATPSDRIIRSATDTKGIELRQLQSGAPVRSYLDGQFIVDKVHEVTRPRKKKRAVKITLWGNDPTFIAGHVTGRARGKRGGVVGHNNKPLTLP